MFKFLHHLFNPHCPDCILDRECKTCDTLRSILEQERFEKKQLLNQILELTKLETVTQVSYPEIKPEDLKPRHIPWRVKQQELEANDRVTAEILRKRKQEEVESLEEKIGIKENAS